MPTSYELSANESSHSPDHYSDKYWNDLPAVLSYLCRRSTGNPELWWMDYFKSMYATPPFKRGLVIGCGNGWVKRNLIDRCVAEHFDAFDFSESYLKEAEEKKAPAQFATFRQISKAFTLRISTI